MTTLLDPPLTPRNGVKLQGLLICRVSDPEKKKDQLTKKKRRRRRARRRQDERSLDDQEAMLREWVLQNTSLPYDLEVIAGTGSGEWPDREEVTKTEEAIKSDLYDFVACEDLGRIVRRQKAFEICELAEDHCVRIFAINDFLDTGRLDWRMSAYFASMRHEMYNQDLRRRIRRSHRNRFQQGDVFQCEIYGYVVPDPVENEPVNDEDVTKDPAAEPVYDEWFTKLDKGSTFAEIADWLNDCNVPTGPYCRLDKWDCRMVGRVTRNPILKGLRVRNDRMSKRVNMTGKSRSVKAPPEERLVRECPHLAFISPERYDRILAKVNGRNAKYRRGKDGVDSRAGVSKKRTRYPGQSTFCGICGRMFVFGGHGQTDHLMCDGARHYLCWNGATFNASDAAKKIATLVSQQVEMLKDFDPVFLEMLQKEAKRANELLDVELARMYRELRDREAEAANLLGYLKNGSQSDLVRNELPRVELEIARQKVALVEAERARPTTINLPSAEELRQLFHGSIRDLAVDSYEFASHLRRLVPRIVVFPHMLCDGGPVVLRARFRLQLASLIPDPGARAALREPLEQVLEVDLFDLPQREEFRTEVVARRKNQKERFIAAALGITQPAVQHAAALQRIMDRLGITDPYLPVVTPPTEGKLKRHKHERYRFEPLPGAGEV